MAFADKVISNTQSEVDANTEKLVIENEIKMDPQPEQLNSQLVEPKLLSEAIKNYGICKHIVFFSSGIGSYVTAKRVIESVGKDNVVLVFADTKMEDIDNYRFLDEAVTYLGCEYHYLTNGMDIFELWLKNRAISNNQMPFCSIQLKQNVCRKWVNKYYKKDQCLLYVGIDIWEEHRRKKITEAWAPYTVVYPMCNEPYLSKQEMIEIAIENGIQPPRLYSMGFAHANCGGACVRAGIAQWSHLYKVNYPLFEKWMIEEQYMRTELKKNISILRRYGKPYPLTTLMIDLRKGTDLDMSDYGNECSCFSYND